MAWIESHQSLARHPKTLRATAFLHCDRFKLIGHLHALWWWALDCVDADGDLGDLSDEEIEMGAEWDGESTQFVRALEHAKFIDVTKGGRFLHDWYDYAGKLLEERARERERSRARRKEARAASGSTADDRRTTGGRYTGRPTNNRWHSTQPNSTEPRERQKGRRRGHGGNKPRRRRASGGLASPRTPGSG